VGIQGFLQCGLEFRAVRTRDPEWIPRDEGLAEYDELATFFRGVANVTDDFGKRRVAL